MNILQDILGLITKGKVKPPTGKDYMVVASYTDAQEILKPQPKMQANLVSLSALKNYIISSIAPPTPPTYKVFTAIVRAWDNDPPIFIELENTIGAINFNKEADGVYSIVSDSLFTQYKTVIFYGSLGKTDNVGPTLQLISEWQSTSSIKLFTFSEGVASNFVIWEMPIEIRVYN
jgi:hypothetical protein